MDDMARNSRKNSNMAHSSSLRYRQDRTHPYREMCLLHQLCITCVAVCYYAIFMCVVNTIFS